MNVEKIKILIVEPTLDPYVKEVENTLEKKQKNCWWFNRICGARR